MMNDLIQTIQVLTPEEVKFVNTELDKKEFTVSTIGFNDGDTGEPRVDSDVRSSSGCYLPDHEEVTQVMHQGLNSAFPKGLTSQDNPSSIILYCSGENLGG